MDTKQIAVTGAHGQLGNELQAIQENYPDFQFHFLSRADLDISDAPAIEAFFAANKVHALINGAAYTAVDQAETEQKFAYKINAESVGNLAKACEKVNVPFVHFSTDYVYHLPAEGPWNENDPTAPKGVYAASKLKGDELALRYNRSLVLRTSWVYSAFGKNFVKTMLRLGKSREELSVVFDQIGSPTYARDLAEASLHVLSQCFLDGENTNNYGLFHYSNEGVCSWYDFAIRIFELADIQCAVHPIVSAQYPTPAQRPSFSVLNKAKIKEQFGLVIPHWSTSLENCLRELEEL
ncbi:MAG: dTDP-4-dehydrorhamnose reductase [Bacteroidota bacterium]